METARFTVPSLDGYRRSIDLGNSLIAMKGVARIDLDSSAHTVDVEFDPGYTSVNTLRTCIRDSGYPVDDGTARQ